MVKRAKSICRHPGCSVLLELPGYCTKHIKVKRQQDDANRGTASERGYTSAWTRARAHYLRKHPLCVFCQRDGFIQAASVVDHIVPHRLKEAIDSGDEARIAIARELFWNSANWQSLCKPHHDREKQKIEKSSRNP